MLIDIPFFLNTALDTFECAKLTAGPDADTMRTIENTLERGYDPDWTTFKSTGGPWRILIEQIQRHPVMVDAWWLQGVLDNDTKVYAIWAPDNIKNSYLTQAPETVWIRRTGYTPADW